MKAILMTISMMMGATSAFAAGPKISKADLVKVVRADSVGRAALAQLAGSNCRLDVKKAPAAPYENFVLYGTCTQAPDEYTGGGVYLMIEITGQYWNDGQGELQKVELGHAG